MQEEYVQISSDDETDTHERILRAKKLVYEHKYGVVEFDLESLKCLEDEAYLNDAIISFFLAYLRSEICDEDVAGKIIVFDSIFYEQLGKIFQVDSLDEVRLEQLYKWYDGVDIFEKHFLIFPVCHEDHWFAIIVCHPAAVPDVNLHETNGVYDKSDTDDCVGSSDDKVSNITKEPGVIVLDSLNLKQNLVTMRVRDFLDHIWRARSGRPKNFSYHNLRDYHPTLPKQINAYDCGIYMLAYIRSFVERPERFFRIVRSANDEELESVLCTNINKCLNETSRESLKKTSS